jgi:tRNA U34 5-methylaminomethyl-2-thiouridine-forming methyltransferase MnmC
VKNRYELVRLSNGVHSVHSLEHRETFHPVVGPVAEAEALYVRQLNLPGRFRQSQGTFVIWDVGLGAAANALTVIRALQDIPGQLDLISFDLTLEPLKFALQHTEALGYLHGFEPQLESVLNQRQVRFSSGEQHISWDLHLSDFPTLVAHTEAINIPRPHAILFDAFSPAKNPAMWTAPLFSNLFKLLDPARPCVLPTYSRSTMLRVTLLIAGFFVGVGHATGEKEETTIASNSLSLISEPLDKNWLQATRRSSSAEPLWEPTYRQARLSTETWERLLRHPQFL